MGEPNYGTEEFDKHVKDTFQELWAVATIRLNGKTWLVGRPLAGPGGDFAIEDGRVESVFAAVPTFSGYRKFTEALENECGKPLARMYPEEAWRNLLPWIARDQEARFSTITAWRDSSSEADNPRTSVAAQHLILRAVLGLLHPDEFDMRAEVSTKEDEIKGWNGSVPIKQSLASRDLAAVRKTLDSVPRLLVELVDLEAAKKKVTSQMEIRQEALEHFQKQPESDEVVAARKALQDAVTAQATANARIATLDAEIPALKQQAEKSLLLVDDIKKKGLRDPKRVADKFCPNSYLKAVERECVEASPEDVEASMVEISELEEQAKSLADSVQAKQDEKARLESRTDQLAAAIIQKNIDLSAAIKRFPSPALAIEREITLLEKAEEELDTAMESAKALDELNTNILRAQNRIFTLKEKLNHLKSEADKKLRSFSEIFADISRAVLGGTSRLRRPHGRRHPDAREALLPRTRRRGRGIGQDHRLRPRRRVARHRGKLRPPPFPHPRRPPRSRHGPCDLRTVFPLRPPDRGFPAPGRGDVPIHPHHHHPPTVRHAGRQQVAARGETEREDEGGEVADGGFLTRTPASLSASDNDGGT